MSLLTGMLRWNLLEGMGVNGAFPTEIFLAIRDDGATGSGLETDPLNCNLPGFVNDFDSPNPGFDEVMRRLGVQFGTKPLSVRLQPGTYYTFGTTGFNVKSSWKIEGSGRSSTYITSSEHSSIGEHAYAIGTQSSGVSGFELKGLSIAMFQPFGITGQYGGVNVTGRNIRISDVWVTNFGSNKNSPQMAVYGICVANASNSVAPFNCVIENCAVASPNATGTDPYASVLWGNTVQAVAFSIRSSAAGYMHTACAIRDSYANGGSNQQTLIGLTAGGGVLSTVDGNRIIFAKLAGPTVGATFGEIADGELQGSRNYSAYVPTWTSTGESATHTISLMWIEDNLSDLESATNVTAMSGASGGAIWIADISNNRTRRLSAIASGDKGFRVMNASYLSMQDNVAGVLKDANGRYIVGIEYENSTEEAFFSDVTPTVSPAPVGYDLLRGYKPSAGLLAEELTTKAEDMLLGI